MDVLAAKGDDVAEVDIDLKRQPRSGNFCVQCQADAAVLFLEACRLGRPGAHANGRRARPRPTSPSACSSSSRGTLIRSLNMASSLQAHAGGCAAADRRACRTMRARVSSIVDKRMGEPASINTRSSIGTSSPAIARSAQASWKSLRDRYPSPDPIQAANLLAKPNDRQPVQGPDQASHSAVARLAWNNRA